MNTRNDSTIRQYRPAVGKLAKMSQFSDYTSRGLNPWTSLRVIGIDRDTVTVKPAPDPSKPEKDGEQITVPLYVIDPPIGWQPQYTIHCKPEETQKVLGWFARGIVVRASHALENAGNMAFQPMDNSVSPHWQFVEVTDAVLPEDCPKVFRIVEFTEQEINFVPNPSCKWCNGSGRDTLARVAKVRNEDVETTKQNVGANLTDLRDDGTFECSCRYGGFRAMGRTKRRQLIRDMEKDGWKVWYEKYAGGFYMRRKETIVHDWAK